MRSAGVTLAASKGTSPRLHACHAFQEQQSPASTATKADRIDAAGGEASSRKTGRQIFRRPETRPVSWRGERRGSSDDLSDPLPLAGTSFVSMLRNTIAARGNIVRCFHASVTTYTSANPRPTAYVTLNRGVSAFQDNKYVRMGEEVWIESEITRTCATLY